MLVQKSLQQLWSEAGALGQKHARRHPLACSTLTASIPSCLITKNSPHAPPHKTCCCHPNGCISNNLRLFSRNLE